MMFESQRWLRPVIGLLLCAAIWALPARQASADPSCTASMSALSFGDVDLVNGGPASFNAVLSYTCTNDLSNERNVRLCFDIGEGSASIDSGGGKWNPRVLRNYATGSLLNFQLYQGATSNIWGSTGQPASDAYDIVVTLPRRTDNSTPSVTTATLNVLRGQILAGQAGLPPGLYESSFTGNHTAFRFVVPNNPSASPGDCSTTNGEGGTFGFAVTANVAKSCMVTADTLDFGSVDGFASSTNIDATTTIRVTCSKPTPYTVALVPLNISSTTGSSAMKGLSAGNTDTVPYRLYRNAGRDQPWGSEVGTNTLAGTGDGLTQSLTVYGRVPGLPNVQPDNYRDTVTVNVAY